MILYFGPRVVLRQRVWPSVSTRVNAELAYALGASQIFAFTPRTAAWAPGKIQGRSVPTPSPRHDDEVPGPVHRGSCSLPANRPDLRELLWLNPAIGPARAHP